MGTLKVPADCSAHTSKRDGLARKQVVASSTTINSTLEIVIGLGKCRSLRPRIRTILPQQPRLRLPIVHETTHRHSAKGPIAIGHALKMHLSE
jgi:hypothetical protein